MMDKSAQRPRSKKENNLWYLLATLYGEPTPEDADLQARNRTAWNRYMARVLTDERRALLAEKGHSAEDLEPLEADELLAFELAFAERHRQATSTATLAIPDPESHEIDFSDVDYTHFPVQGFVFPVASRFNHAKFDGLANFENVIFCDLAVFNGVHFCGFAGFGKATFLQWAAFKGVTFSLWAGFEHAVVSRGVEFTLSIFSEADFTSAIFSGDTHFSRATFGIAYLTGATFSGETYFTGATFRKAVFVGAKFSSAADFETATFTEEANFRSAIFDAKVNFTSAKFKAVASFTNAEMKDETWFEAAKFKTRPPMFFNAKLHEGTFWHSANWPNPPENRSLAAEFVYAYERLKLEMDRLKKHEDELDFFARELQCRRILQGDWKQLSKLKIPAITVAARSWSLYGRRVAVPSFTTPAWTITLHRPASGLSIALYGFLGDYGRSYIRPILGLLVTVAAGIPLFWHHFGLAQFGQACSLSLTSTFAAFGFRKDFIDSDLIASLPGLLKILAGSQTIAGTALLFLFGLALRNRFRMK